MVVRASLFVLSALFCSAPAFAQDPVELELVLWSNNLGGAIDVTHCGDSRLFVLRQWGAITIVSDSGVNVSPAFLDITPQVLYNGERGMLGLAFDPDYANNGHFYVNYVTGTGNGTTRISRFTRSATDPNRADPASEVVLLSIPQPDPIHNGGGLVFGKDGYLYCGLGDGGGSSDPNGYGQTTDDLFGSIIRIKPEPDGTYSIPPDNPFATSPNGERPELFAYGLRNPFRIAVDTANGDLWIGDVGQQLWEEVDRVAGGDLSGPNFGWSCLEGNAPFDTADCATGGLYRDPVVVQAHGINGGNFCAIIAGEVYHGSLFPRMQDRFVYTDYCTGGIRTLTPDGNGGYVDQPGAAVPFPGMSSIGADVNGELFLTNVSFGRLYKLRDKCPMPRPMIMPDGNNLSCEEASTYEWFLDGEPFPQGDTQTIYAWATGNYVVRVTFANGCSKQSEPYFHLSTEVMEISAFGFRAFPQPASTQLWIETEGGVDEVRIYDVAGALVKSVPLSVPASRFTLDLSDLSIGIYAAELMGDRSVLNRGTFAVAR